MFKKNLWHPKPPNWGALDGRVSQSGGLSCAFFFSRNPGGNYRLELALGVSARRPDGAITRFSKEVAGLIHKI